MRKGNGNTPLVPARVMAFLQNPRWSICGTPGERGKSGAPLDGLDRTGRLQRAENKERTGIELGHISKRAHGAALLLEGIDLGIHRRRCVLASAGGAVREW